MTKHYCHWPECNTEVPPKLWGCKTHWYRLPAFIRRRILLTYRPGQEVTKDPSKNYLVAASAAQKWIELSKTYGAKIATETFEQVIKEKGWPEVK